MYIVHTQTSPHENIYTQRIKREEQHTKRREKKKHTQNLSITTACAVSLTISPLCRISNLYLKETQCIGENEIAITTIIKKKNHHHQQQQHRKPLGITIHSKEIAIIIHTYAHHDQAKNRKENENKHTNTLKKTHARQSNFRISIVPPKMRKKNFFL